MTKTRTQAHAAVVHLSSSRSPSPRVRPTRRCSRVRADGREACRPSASCVTSCRSRREATGPSSATRSKRCSAAAHPRTRTRFRSSDVHAAACWVCTRPGAAGRAHARTARCCVGSSRSMAVVTAPISSGARSGCASTSSPSSRTCSRSGVALDIEREAVPASAPLRWDPIRPLTGLGDWLARVRWVDGVPDRSLRPWRAFNERTMAGPSRFPKGRSSG